MSQFFGVTEITQYSIFASSEEEALEYVRSEDFDVHSNRVQNVETEEVILETEYQERRNRLRFLVCLESVGVDNWSGYGMAWDLFEGKEPTF